jgi:cell fate regulator YaaT (PSP1 superfamily)
MPEEDKATPEDQKPPEEESPTAASAPDENVGGDAAGEAACQQCENCSCKGDDQPEPGQASPPEDAAGEGEGEGEGESEGESEGEGETKTPSESVVTPAEPRKRAPRPGWLCTALHGKMSRVDYFSAPNGHGFPHRCKVILRTDRGTEMGAIVASPVKADLAELKKRPGEVLRAATSEDLERQRAVEKDVEPTELKECTAEVAEHKLPMRLVAAEHLFGGEKIVYYFMADGRVDFRKLVREMARKYRTRIEFRQIGVRDEARLLAEYEHCGQPLCCRQFLRGLEPVTMRMAKLQKATLDPAKISGRCGRLMCCLRYEEEVYSHLRTKLPPRGVYVLTEEVAGQVLSGDIISQRVTIDTGSRRAQINVKDIQKISRERLEQPALKLLTQPLTPELPARRRPSRPKPSPAGKQPQKQPEKQPGAAAQKSEGGGEKERPPGSRRRSGRRRGGRSRGRRRGGGGGGGSGSSGNSSKSGGSGGGAPKA